jgi:hypothetical protein
MQIQTAVIEPMEYLNIFPNLVKKLNWLPIQHQQMPHLTI